MSVANHEISDVNKEKLYDRVAMIARWKPIHLGHQAILNAMCRKSREVLIGIGSANRYNLRNPFTLDETRDMLRLTLQQFDNFILIPVNDLDDGPRWRAMVIQLFGNLDFYITDNPYVTSLLKDNYTIVQPHTWVEDPARVPVDGTAVRQLMARGDDWASLVPPEVASYIINNRLDMRFREEFGLQTLALETYLERRS